MLTLLSILLLEGFVTISIEILTIRQMIPFVGNSVIVTSIIIGIFLLFLALGYRRGGSYTDHYKSRLRGNFIKAALWISFGMSSGFIYSFFLIGSLAPHLLLLYLTLYLFMVTAPIVYILGQTLPITTNLFRVERSVGAISGKALFLSTVGSFLGSVVTTLVLFNYLGVAATVFTNVCILTLLIMMLSDDITSSYSNLTFIVGILLISYFMNIVFEKGYFIHTNNYSDYQVINNFQLTPDNQGSALIINNSISSFLNKENKGAPYIEEIKKILFKDLKLTGKNILVLGAGGFSLSAEGTHNNQFTYVDIDPDIAQVVIEHFNKHIYGKITTMDARIYLKNFNNYYDAIISDVYSNRATIPAHLLTQEHFENLYNALKANGTAIFNIIMNPQFSDTFSTRIDNTISTVFQKCMKIPISYQNNTSNVIYICNKSIKKIDDTVYVDDLNQSTLDYFKVN